MKCEVYCKSGQLKVTNVFFLERKYGQKSTKLDYYKIISGLRFFPF